MVDRLCEERPEARVCVSVPPNVRIFEVGTDYLLGLARAELDVQSVVVYPVSYR